MNEIVKRLQENREIERAKQIMESAGYQVSKVTESLSDGEQTEYEEEMHMRPRMSEADDIEKYDDSEIIREGCALGHDSSEVWLRTGRDYHLTFSLKTSDDTVYEKLEAIFNKSIGEAIEYCMKRNFTVSYEGTVLS